MVTSTEMADSSTTEFNEPEFPEYDPTPYGGGYDISITYGKPLPPSDKICYPRSKPTKHSPPPQVETKIDHIPTHQNGSPPPFNIPIESKSGKKSPESEYDYSPNGYNSPLEENGYYDYEKQVPVPSSDGYYDYGRQVPPPPSEYVEPCATLFGYWPCLLKDYQKNVVQQGCREQGYAYEWMKTEEYIFGSSYQFGDARGDGVSRDFHYGYEQHYVEQPRRVKYVEQPSSVQEEYNVAQLSYSQYSEQPSYVKYIEQPSYVREEFDVEQPSSFTYVEQPSYVQEEYNVEQPSYLQYSEQPSYVEYMEQPSYVQEEYNVEQPSYLHYVEQPSSFNYMEQPSYVQEGYNVEQPSSFNYMEQPSYAREEYNVEQPSYAQYVKQPSYVQDEYNPKLWSQTLNNSYYETYQES